MQEYKLIPLTNVFDAIKVKNIRNESSLFMTSDTSQISLIREVMWYFTKYLIHENSGRLKVFLFKKEGDVLGYGKIRIDTDKKQWITGVISENQRGKGLGNILFKEIIDEVDSKEVWLEVLKSNNRAFNLYKKLGFKVINKTKRNKKDILVMQLLK